MFLASLACAGMLRVSSGGFRTAYAAPVVLQNTPMNQIIKSAGPPNPMCLGDTAAIVEQFIFRVPGETATILMSVSAGVLGKTEWPVSTPGGVLIETVTTEYTATETGEVWFYIGVEGISMVGSSFEVVDCGFELRFSAIEHFQFEDVHIQMVIEGNGVMASDAKSLYGEGKYTVSMLVGYAIEEQDLTCAIISPSTGTGVFIVSGSRMQTDLNISFQFSTVQLSGGRFKCVDSEGKETDVPDIFTGSVNPQGYLPLTNITVTPNLPFNFDFGKTGVGIVDVIPIKIS